MIVIFGASSGIGRGTTAKLLDAGHAVRVVAHSPRGLDARAQYFPGGVREATPATADASTVISCAHARHAPILLAALAPSVKKLVLIGSTWRYRSTPDAAVKSAEEAFLASGRAGVMLHPTMIYGGSQENNLRRMLAMIHRLPVIPLPSGGTHLVQPIYIDDVVDCIVAATLRDWTRPTVLTIAGPRPFAWSAMLHECMAATGKRRPTFSVPLSPFIGLLSLAKGVGLPVPVDPGVLQRFRENTAFAIDPMRDELGVKPREFETGLRDALAGWSAVELAESASAAE